MKKLLTICLLIAFSSATWAQQKAPYKSLPKAELKVEKRAVFGENDAKPLVEQVTNKSLQDFGDIYYEEHFANALPAGWTSVDLQGNNVKWVWTNIGATGPTTAGYEHELASTTAANGWMILDSDLAGNNAYDAILTSPVYDFTGLLTPMVVFQELYKRWGSEAANPFGGNPTYVEVTTDGGTTWNQIEIHAAFDVKDETFNPGTMKVNLTPYAANADSVQIRFRMQGYWDYWWQIDDMIITEAPTNDVVLNAEFLPYIYQITGFNSMTPKDHIGWFRMGCDVGVAGVDDQTNVNLNVQISNGIQTVFDWTFDSIGNWEAGTNDSLWITDTAFYADYTMKSNYEATFTVGADAIEDVPEDNTMAPVPFSVTDTTFANDIERTGSIGPWSYTDAADGDKIGTQYYIIADDTLSSVSCFISAYTTPLTTIVTAEVWKYDSGLGDYVLQIDSEPYIIQPEDRGQWISLKLTDDDGFQKFLVIPENASGISVLAMINCTWGSDTLLFGADGTRGSLHDYPSEASLYKGGTWYYISTIPMVRLNIFRSNITNDPLVATIVSSSDVTCFGANDGTATVGVLGGDLNYSYLWNNNMTTSSIAGLSAGAYTVTVTDGTGETATASTFINDSTTEIVITDTITNASCLGGGAISIYVTGGVSPYSYDWSTGDTIPALTSLIGGSYSLTLTDANGCELTPIINVGLSDGPAIDTSMTNVSYYLGSDGAISITVTGGTPPYSYDWSTGATIASIANLTAGTYTVTVADSASCVLAQSFEVTQPALNCAVALTGGVESTTNLTCFGVCNGIAKVYASSYYPPLVYDWTQYPFSNPTATGLCAGQQTVIVTDTMGCSLLISLTLTQPAKIIVTNNGMTQADYAVANGGLDISVTNGIAPLAYAWSNAATTQDLTGVISGWYYVTATDSTGCTGTGAFIITSGIPDCDSLGVSGTASSTDALCYGSATGTGTIIATTTWPPIEYAWPNGQTTATATGLASGVYNVTVTDSANCPLSVAVTVNAPVGIALTIDSTISASYGGFDGAIYVSVSGGAGSLTYLWSEESVTEDLVGIESGWYYLTVTDTNSCEATSAVFLTQDAVDCAADGVSGSITATNVTCNGDSDGMAVVTATSSYEPITYAWSDGQVDDTASNLTADSYVLVMTDNAGCVASLSTDITEPDAISMSGVITNDTTLSVVGVGAINLTVTGGTTPYTFAWDNDSITEDLASLDSNSYQVVVTDAASCMDSVSFLVSVDDPSCTLVINEDTVVDVSCFGGVNGYIVVSHSGGISPFTYLWSNGATTDSIGGLAAGYYSLIVTDSSCVAQTTIQITSPVAITISGIVTDASFGQADGGVNITAAGGTAPYTYSWSNVSVAEDLASVIGQSNYTVTVTDTLLCSKAKTFYVGQANPNCAVSGINASSATISGSNVSCNGGASGSATVTATSSYTPVTYYWSNALTTNAISGLSIGNYAVLVSDAAGCQISLSTTISEPSGISVTGVSTPAGFGVADGAINITAIGGTAPYTYSWTGGSTTEDLTAINGNATYTVVVTDSLLCTGTASFNVTETLDCGITGVTGTISATDALCYETATGSLTVVATSGYTPYSYSLAGSNVSSTINDLGAGIYTVMVEDSANCIVLLTDTIDQPTEVSLSSSQTNASFGVADGTIDLTVSGGTSPYTFFWSDSTLTEDLTGLLAGTFSVTVSDDNGCTGTHSALLTQDAADCATSGVSGTASATDVTCFGLSDGAVSTSATTSYGSITYIWNDLSASTTSSISGLAGGNYSVVLSDSASCTDTLIGQVIEPSALSATVANVNVSCNGLTDGSITVTVDGGTSAYLYAWTPAATTANLTNIGAGTYSLVVTDAHNCTATTSATVSQPDVLTASIDTVLDKDLTLTVTGGTAPYTYAWDNDSITANQTGLLTGTFSVTVTDANLCTATASGDVVNGISEVDYARFIRVYPNPTRGTITISNAENATITVYDLIGNVVAMEKDATKSNSIDISTFADGTYLIKIVSDKYVVTKQIYLVK